MFNCN